VTQAVQHLPSKQKVPNPSTTPKKRKEGRNREKKEISGQPGLHSETLSQKEKKIILNDSGCTD
jgi:hypothetical protein